MHYQCGSAKNYSYFLTETQNGKIDLKLYKKDKTLTLKQVSKSYVTWVLYNLDLYGFAFRGY